METYVGPSRRHTLSTSTPWEFLMMWWRVQRGWQLGVGQGPRLLTGTIFYVFRHFRLRCSIRSQEREDRCKIGNRLRDTV